MSAKLTPAQMELAITANRLALAGFTGAADHIVAALKRQTQVRHYGSFELTAADRGAFAAVEQPTVSPTLDR